MNFSPSPMLLVGTLVAAAIVGAVTPVSAAPAPMTDEAYVAVARCAGLTQGMNRDARALKTMMQAQSGPRTVWVYNLAEETRADAVIEARRAGEDARRHLVAETDGACADLTAASTTIASR